VPLQVLAPAEQLVTILHAAPESPGPGFENDLCLRLGRNTPSAAVLGQPGDGNRNLELVSATFITLGLGRLEVGMSSRGNASRSIFLPARRSAVVEVVLVLDLTLPAGKVITIGDRCTVGRRPGTTRSPDLHGRPNLEGGLLGNDGRVQNLRIACLNGLRLRHGKQGGGGTDDLGVEEWRRYRRRDGQVCNSRAKLVSRNFFCGEAGGGGGRNGGEWCRICEHVCEAGEGIGMDGVAKRNGVAFLKGVPNRWLVGRHSRGNAPIEHHLRVVAEGIAMFDSAERRVIVNCGGPCQKVVRRAKERGKQSAGVLDTPVLINPPLVIGAIDPDGRMLIAVQTGVLGSVVDERVGTLRRYRGCR